MRTHGIAATYNVGCRCDPCKAARVQRNVELRNRDADPTSDSVALTGGRWVPADGIMRWQEDEFPSPDLPGRIELTMADPERRRAHAYYRQGHREDWIVRGEHEFQIAMGRKKRHRAKQQPMQEAS